METFNFDLAGVSTARPCPQEGDYAVTVTNLAVEQKDKGPMLTVTFTFNNDVTGIPTDGGAAPIIPAGYTLLDNYRLYDVENPKAPKFREQLARLIDGVLGTNDATRPTDPAAAFEAMRGRSCLITTKVESTDQYGHQARVKRVKPLNN